MRLTLARRNNNDLGFWGREIDRWVNDFFGLEPFRFFNESWYPQIDIVEDENAIHVKADMPGLTEKDIEVTVENGVLTISGERKEERREEDEKKRYIVNERCYGSFRRSFSLPEGIKADEIKAHFKDGVLSIEIPKSEEVKPKKITVTVN
ncbi:MAG: Hsp20/alpha crystallin family protein [Spirochaetes bacterium]|nr:Hsp20/alpha crystallin family protein [Spirochaetota bacterium]